MACAGVFVKLMKRLGHDKFYAQGGDWGALITTTICTIIPRVGNFTITLNLNIEKYRTNLVVIPVSLVYVSLSYLSQGYHWTPQQYAFKLSLQSARISTSDFSSNFSKAGPWGGTQEAFHTDLETI